MTTTLSPTEINRRVAELCGLPVYPGRINPEKLYRVDLEQNTEATFDPYHDANDALWAAERVGLLQDDGVSLSVNKNACCCSSVEFLGGTGYTLNNHHFAPTLPAAICLAILALKENQT